MIGGGNLWQYHYLFHVLTTARSSSSRRAVGIRHQSVYVRFQKIRKKHNLMYILSLFCNSDYWGISQLNGTLISCGTCGNSDKCDYCVVGSENPMAKEYEIVKDEDGFL